MNEFTIKFSNFSTRIFVGHRFYSQFGHFVKEKLFFQKNCTVVIITDRLVFSLFENVIRKSFLDVGFKVLTFKLACGEKVKSFKSFERICNFLAKKKVKKTDLIVSLGGGVICDLTGFVSSCFLRGVCFVQIPTTLLAMVDACVGGKAAINLKYGKNLIGCFNQPSLVFCDLSFIETLPDALYFNAMSEVVKYAVLFSGSFFKFLVNCGKRLSKYELEKVVVDCLNLKKKLIEIDEFDKKDERIKLNFGHTIGHALEAYFGYSNKLTHGQAVALGMSYCTCQSEKLGLTEIGEFEKLKLVLKKFNLPINFKVSLEKLFRICLNDKKICDGYLKLVLIRKIGCCFVKKFSLDEFKNFLEN